MRIFAFSVILVAMAGFIFLSGCCAMLAPSSQQNLSGFECMESPGCPDHVQRCYDGICTPASTCGAIHWDNGSACNCTTDIGPWTRQATSSCKKMISKTNNSGFECMESPGCFEHVQRCYDGICTPISSCGVIHWDNASACNCTTDIGPWTRQATASCSVPAN